MNQGLKKELGGGKSIYGNKKDRPRVKSLEELFTDISNKNSKVEDDKIKSAGLDNNGPLFTTCERTNIFEKGKCGYNERKYSTRVLLVRRIASRYC